MKSLVSIAVLSSLALFGCAKSEVAKDEGKLNMANPAAVFCEQHGSYDLATGECLLSSGKSVDAWTYYREQHSDKDVKSQAQRYCEATEGAYEATSQQCTLANGDVMDAEEYFRDHQASSN
ncbi:putative hemolysin [Vibrio cionasavignyae]|uniref:putative hemolysin n=1 Tax=Vibrio cionasavignyae TaxID=2910252 RepID=UPI003D0F7480